MRDSIIVGVVVGTLFFAAGAILTALAIKYATSSDLWDFVLWGGVALMTCSVATLGIYISSQIWNRSFLLPATIIDLGICLIVVGLVWHFQASNPFVFPKLEDYFAKDFNFLALNTSIGVHAVNGADGLDTTVDCPFKLLQDFSTNTEFIAVFVPFFSDNRLAAMKMSFLEHLKSDIIDSRKTLRERIGTGGSTPGSPMTYSKDLSFSGRVFIYTMNDFDPVELGQLVQSYRQSGLVLEIRGSDYLFIRSRH